MIYHTIPYDYDGNLGAAYNEYMKICKPNDWMFFFDGDTCLLDNRWGKIIKEAVDKFPDTGLFTAYTNRVGYKSCLLIGFDKHTDILFHYELAKCQADQSFRVRTLTTKYVSGFMLGLKKEVYDLIGPFRDGFFGVDDNYSKRIKEAGFHIRLIERLYIYHYYRSHQDKKSVL